MFGLGPDSNQQQNQSQDKGGADFDFMATNNFPSEAFQSVNSELFDPYNSSFQNEQHQPGASSEEQKDNENKAKNQNEIEDLLGFWFGDSNFIPRLISSLSKKIDATSK